MKNLIYFIILLISISSNIYFAFYTEQFSILAILSVAIILFIYYAKWKKYNYNPYDKTFTERESLLKKLNECKGKRPKALILINIDSFEDINDSFGYEFGDKVLKEILLWLKKQLPDKHAKLYKLEADNYAIYTENYKTKEELISYLEKLSTNIINMKFTICDNELDIGFTIGAAINQENLLKLTRSAFKKSKLKKTPYEIYTHDQDSEDMRAKNIKINKIIKKSLQQNDIIPLFQPIYDLRLHTIKKYESLMRIKTEENKYLLPDEFLDISKRSKLYPKLTKEIFRQVSDSIGASNIEYSINISVDDILNKETSSFILNRLEKSDVGSWLIFEILESEGIENYQEVTKFLRDIKSLGARIAIDDFGSGYSNFEYILKLDVDFLKVDGSLIRNIDINEDTQIIASTIVDFAKKLHIKTIAEFVHNKDIYETVKQLGFDYAQGYYIGKPEKNLLTAKDFEYLKEQTIFDFV